MTDSRTGVNVAADQDPGTPVAHIVHQVPGRVRFRLPSKRGDAAFFARAADTLRVQAGVVAVATDARTGSVLVEHSLDADAVVSLAAANAPFHVTGAQARQGPKAAALSAAAAGFAALGTYQLARGRVAGNALENFWNAYGAYAVLGQPWASAALVGVGLYQLANRRILGPAVSLYFYALTARHMAQTGGPEAAI